MAPENFWNLPSLQLVQKLQTYRVSRDWAKMCRQFTIVAESLPG